MRPGQNRRRRVERSRRYRRTSESLSTGELIQTRKRVETGGFRNCPCCTLPLKTLVMPAEPLITAFLCGHAYHKVCLRAANLRRCVRCEYDRRQRRLPPVNAPVRRPVPRPRPP
jgi:hypothetical protein